MHQKTTNNNTKNTTTMEKTNNKITVKTWKSEYKEVPVMRNGKPTKKTKRTLVYTDIYLPASGYMIQGHELFIIDRDLENAATAQYWFDKVVCLYRADGSKLTCNCKYGRYGTANHEQVLLWDTENKCLYTDTHGWDGAAGKGWGARMSSINW